MTDEIYEVDLIDYDINVLPLAKDFTAAAVYSVEYDIGYHGEQVTTPTLMRIACDVKGQKFDIYPDNITPDQLADIHEICNEHLRDIG